MLTKFLDYLQQNVSPTFLWCASGISTFSIMAGIDWYISFCRLEIRIRRNANTGYMRGLVIQQRNGIQVVQVVEDLPIPHAESNDDVVIKVIAAGADAIDASMCYREKHDDNFVIPGHDCAGIVVETGKKVQEVKEGDHVWAVSPELGRGLMTEFVVVKESQLGIKPDNISFEEAASIPYIGIFTWKVLVEQCKLGPRSTYGKRFLIHNCNTAFGLLAIQLLKAWGGHVTATVPTLGLPISRVFECDDVIVYSVTNFEVELKKRQKFNVILNFSGKYLHESCLDMCTPGGKVVSLWRNRMKEESFEFDLPALFHNFYFWCRKNIIRNLSQLDHQNLVFANKTLHILYQLVQTKQVKPIVEDLYSLENAPKAFQQLSTYKIVGRPVIQMNEISSSSSSSC